MLFIFHKYFIGQDVYIKDVCDKMQEEGLRTDLSKLHLKQRFYDVIRRNSYCFKLTSRGKMFCKLNKDQLISELGPTGASKQRAFKGQTGVLVDGILKEANKPMTANDIERLILNRGYRPPGKSSFRELIGVYCRSRPRRYKNHGIGRISQWAIKSEEIADKV